jgi:hypothetical protein
MDGPMMRPSAHRLTPKRAMIKVPVDNAAGTGAGLHLLLSGWPAIVTCIGSDVRDLDSIGQGSTGFAESLNSLEGRLGTRDRSLG